MTERESFALLVECRNLLEFIDATLRARKQGIDKPMLKAIEAIFQRLLVEGTGG